MLDGMPPFQGIPGAYHTAPARRRRSRRRRDPGPPPAPAPGADQVLEEMPRPPPSPPPPTAPSTSTSASPAADPSALIHGALLGLAGNLALAFAPSDHRSLSSLLSCCVSPDLFLVHGTPCQFGNLRQGLAPLCFIFCGKTGIRFLGFLCSLSESCHTVS